MQKLNAQKRYAIAVLVWAGLWSLLCPHGSEAQTLSELAGRADSLCAIGKSEEAFLWLEHSAYRAKRPGNRNFYLLLKGEAQLKEKQHERAYRSFLRLEPDTLPDTLVERYVLDFATAAYLSEHYHSLDYLERTQRERIRPQAQALFDLLLTASLERRGYLEAADKAWQGLPQAWTQPMAKDWRKKRYKNPKTARLLSLVPGLGQVYAGYPGKGLMSLGLTGTMGLFWANSIALQLYSVSLATAPSLFFTSYLGGLRYAGRLAEQKNQSLRRQNAKLLEERFFKALE